MEPKILYNQGANAVTLQSLFIIAALLLVTVGCLVFMEIRRRRGTLSTEMRWILISVAVLTGGTLLLFALSALPDVLQPPLISRGRIMKIYQKKLSADDSPITYIDLSTQLNLQVPAALVPDLKPGACLEVTRTAATGYIMIARELPVDACLTS